MNNNQLFGFYNIAKSLVRFTYTDCLKVDMLSNKKAGKRIVWIDLEMTGLDVDKDHILEIACLVTDENLNIVATGPNLVIHQPSAILDSMNTWCKAQHDCLKVDMLSNKKAGKRIVWIDLEMTGLDVDKDHILEIACLVTDENLNIVATGPNLVIHQPSAILDSMNTWCKAQHGESGLMEASKNSQINVEAAEKQILDFVSQHVPSQKCPMAGNSIYMDRLFIMKYMPKLNSYLHYRIIDVSSIKELAKRWYLKEYYAIPQKRFKHRAIDDILESVQELKHYKEYIFKS